MMVSTKQKLVGLDEIRAAQKSIAGVAVRTGLYELDQQRLMRVGFRVEPEQPAIFLKAESEQPVGSFKLRGAYNKIASLTKAELERGVITYSSGNHAQGVAYAARQMGVKATIVMPNTAPRVKQEATRELGGEIVLVGPGSVERRERAEAMAAEHGYTLIPPYDDDLVIAGQGTVGIEILEDRPSVGLILAPIGGGGLLSGIAAAVKATNPNIKVMGVEPELAADAKESLEVGSLMTWPIDRTSHTVADGLRTQCLGDRNLEHLKALADGVVTVSEDEILRATRLVLAATDLVAEPSGAVALAAALFHWKELPTVSEIAVVLSGGNLDPQMKDRILAATR